jgi:hypothetical protein
MTNIAQDRTMVRGRGRRRVPALVVAAGFVIGTAPAMVATASADSSGSSTGTVNIVPPVRSVTVSAASFGFAHCTGGTSTIDHLGYPNGTCDNTTNGNQITVTNTGVPGHVNVQATNASPFINGVQENGGTPWTLVSGGLLPLQDQFSVNNINTGQFLSTAQAGDAIFGASGAAAANQLQAENLLLRGPLIASDNQATSFATAVTWTAVQ